jgi:hypothetical protein
VIGNVPTWHVVGEFQTKQTTARQHARGLVEYLQTFGVEHRVERQGRRLPDPDSPKALIVCDPHGKGEDETDYDSVYRAMQHEGLDVISPSSLRIRRRPRIEMVNRLLSDATFEPRLVVATDAQGQPRAPRLVEAFETLEKRPGDDDPEGLRRKDEADQTHAPACIGYGLWLFEREMATAETVRLALAAARRLR